MSNTLYIQELILPLMKQPLPELTIDSSSLHSLATSVKEPEEKYNKVDLAAIKEAFDEGKINAIHWCPGTKLIAYSLSKHNPVTAALLKKTLRDGTHVQPREMKTVHGPSS